MKITTGVDKTMTGCCEPRSEATPEIVSNRHGLDAIEYRVGRFGSFRQAMIQEIPRSAALSSLTTRGSSDFSIGLLDLWAYLGDILTFYQERIANEAYLRTALHRSSILRFAALLDYRTAPGIAAETYLALDVDAETSVSIPAGLRVQSVPGPGEAPQKFETAETFEALAEWNRIGPRLREPQIPEEGVQSLYLEGIDTALEPGDGILLVSTEWGAVAIGTPDYTRWAFKILQTVETREDEGYTLATWKDGVGSELFPLSSSEDVEIFAFRRRAPLFGHNAPDWSSLAKETKKSISEVDPLPEEWPGFGMTKGIILDSVYEGVLTGSWVVLANDADSTCELYRASEVHTLSIADFMLASQVTSVTPEGPQLALSERRKTTAHIESERLQLAERPITLPLSGATIEIDNPADGLTAGNRIIVSGESEAGDPLAEVAVISEVKPSATHATITLSESLQHTYKRDTVAILANVVRVTHGETIEDEILGDGDAAEALQRFGVKKSPVTFVSDATAEHGAANSLRVRVGGIEWSEVPTLYGCGPHDRVFTTSADEDDMMSIQFGDGVAGSRVPSGWANLVGTYRQGIGPDGNVRAGTLTTLLDRPAGLKKARNPIAAAGGAERETRDQARENAPNTVRTFERIISLRDFEDSAREYAGIAKAKAVTEWSGLEERVRLTVAGDDGAEIPPDQMRRFREYLDSRRDPNRQLLIAGHAPVRIEVAALIEVDPAYEEEEVKKQAQEALLAHFAFANRNLGTAVHLSDLYQALATVDGASAARVDRLRRLESSTDPDLMWHVPIDADEIATLSSEGLLVDTGQVRA
ncbi:putative baseplate assembly protein [Candidatus Bipolaricaulota bacterium]